MKPSTKLIQNCSKEIKSDNFCYRKVGRAITKWGAIEKSPILLSQYWKSYHFWRVTKIISHFDGSNNIFADCISICYTLGWCLTYNARLVIILQNPLLTSLYLSNSFLFPPLLRIYGRFVLVYIETTLAFPWFIPDVSTSSLKDLIMY